MTTYRGCSDGACGIRKGVDEIDLDRQEAHHHSSAEDTRANDRQDPMEALVGCPAVPTEGRGGVSNAIQKRRNKNSQKPDRNDERANEHDWDAEFRLANAVVPFLEL